MLGKEKSREVRLQIRAILMTEWDPIGVSDVPHAADEYDSYIGGVYELLEQGESEESISAYLREIETERMGMTNASGEPIIPEGTRNAAAASLKRLGHYFR